MNHYFISFSHTGNGGGFGNCQIDWATPIRSAADIDAITGVLRREGVVNPVIVSFTRFDETVAEQDTATSNPDQSGPLDGIVFDYIRQLLQDQGRPLSVEQIADLLALPVTVVHRIITKASNVGRLEEADGRYTLPGSAR